jgi:AraC-like DNA-binding protein
MGMESRCVLPVEALSKHVRRFWILEGSGSEATGESAAFKVLADGYPGLVFQENERALRDASGQSFPPLFLHGIATRHSGKIAMEAFRNIKIDLYPECLPVFFGPDAQEITDRHIDLGLLVKSDLADRLLEAPLAEERIRILTGFMLDKIRLHEYSHAKLRHALALMRDPSGISLPCLRKEVGLSERALERLFTGSIGVTPKVFSRILRFQNFMKTARHGSGAALTTLAYASGYADQSHCLREFKSFAGCGPREFLRRAGGQVANFPEWNPR